MFLLSLCSLYRRIISTITFTSGEMQDRVAHLESIESQQYRQTLHNPLAEDVKLEQLDLDLSSLNYSASPLALTHNSGLHGVASDKTAFSSRAQDEDFTQLSSPLAHNAFNINNQLTQNFGANWQDSYDVLGTDFLAPTYTGLQHSDFQSYDFNTPSTSSYESYHLQATPLHGLDHLSLPTNGTELNTHHLQSGITHDPFNTQFNYDIHDQSVPPGLVDYNSPLYYQGNGPGHLPQLPDEQPHHLPLLELPRNEDHALFHCLNDLSQIPLPQLPELPAFPGRNDLFQYDSMHNYLHILDVEPNPTDRIDQEVGSICQSPCQSPGPPNIAKTSTSSHDSRKQGSKPLTLKDLAHDDSRFAKVVMAFVSISDEKRRTVTEIAKQVSVLFPEKYGDFEYVKVCV